MTYDCVVRTIRGDIIVCDADGTERAYIPLSSIACVDTLYAPMTDIQLTNGRFVSVQKTFSEVCAAIFGDNWSERWP